MMAWTVSLNSMRRRIFTKNEKAPNGVTNYLEYAPHAIWNNKDKEDSTRNYVATSFIGGAHFIVARFIAVTFMDIRGGMANVPLHATSKEGSLVSSRELGWHTTTRLT